MQTYKLKLFQNLIMSHWNENMLKILELRLFKIFIGLFLLSAPYLVAQVSPALSGLRIGRLKYSGGGDWYNDSIATAPERAIAAIESFTEPMILLAGGKDKNLPWERFAELVCQRVKHLILFGEAAGKISNSLTKFEKESVTTVTYCQGLKEAVLAAANKVNEGDVVLLSPGGTSFDEFHDFEDRGEAFKKWVMELP